MTLTQQITLDIYDPPYFEYVNAKQADNISRILIITLTAHGEELKPSAGTETAVFRALKPDRTSVIDPAVIGQDGKITVALTDQALACPGRVEADVSVLKGDEVLSSATFYIQVDKAPVSGAQIASSDEFLVMVQAAREAEAAAGDARKAAGEAGTAAGKANAAAGSADTATGRANDAARLLEGMTVTASEVPSDGTPTAALTKKGDHYELELGLKTGKPGPVSSVNGGTGDVVLGGRNYAKSVSNIGYGAYQGNRGSLTLETVNGNEVLTYTSGTISGSKYMEYRIVNANTVFPYDTFLTVSAWIYAEDPSIKIKADMQLASTDGIQVIGESDDIIPAGKWTKVTCTGKFVQSRHPDLRVDFFINNSADPGPGITFKIFHPKLEIGTVATDWTPAPEDIPGVENAVIGGKNLFLPRQGSVNAGKVGSGTLNRVDGVNVPEWGASDAIRFSGTKDSATSGIFIVEPNPVMQGSRGLSYTFSIYVKNNGNSSVYIDKLSRRVVIEPLSSTRVSFTAVANGETNLNFIFYSPESNDYDVTIWHPQIELGTAPTVWSYGDVPEMHRNIFRGKYLGNVFTDEQKAAIAAGTWDGLYLGDYWTINGHTWRIADFDYWLGKGDTGLGCTTHHIVIVPDTQLYVAQMRNTASGEFEAGDANTTEGGYYNSDMRQKNLAQAKEMIEVDFGAGSILNHRIQLTNAVKDGCPSGGAWYDSEVDLMNEMMVYGAFHFHPMGNGTLVPYIYTTETTQLALFQMAPKYIVTRQWYWLRDVVSASFFANVHSCGNSRCYSATLPSGVRPAVGIVGAAQSADEPIEGPEMMDTYSGAHEE